MLSSNIHAKDDCKKSDIKKLQEKIRATYKHPEVMWKHLHDKEKRTIRRDLATDPSLEIYLEQP